MKKKVWKSSCRSNLMWVTVSSDSSTFARSSFYYGPSTSRAESIDEDGCLVHRGNKLAYSSSSFIRPAALLENPFGLPPGPLYFVSFFFFLVLSFLFYYTNARHILLLAVRLSRWWKRVEAIIRKQRRSIVRASCPTVSLLRRWIISQL